VKLLSLLQCIPSNFSFNSSIEAPCLAALLEYFDSLINLILLCFITLELFYCHKRHCYNDFWKCLKDCVNLYGFRIILQKFYQVFISSHDHLNEYLEIIFSIFALSLCCIESTSSLLRHWPGNQVRCHVGDFCCCCFLGQETLLPLPLPPVWKNGCS